MTCSVIQAEPELFNSCFLILSSLVTSQWDKTFGKFNSENKFIQNTDKFGEAALDNFEGAMEDSAGEELVPWMSPAASPQVA